MKRIINTAKAPAPVGPYNQAVLHNNTLYVSGQIALDPATGQLVSGDIETETRRVLDNLRAILEEAGLTLQSLWPISTYFPSPGGSDEQVYLYLGRCSTVDAGGVHGLEEEGEDIRVHVWSLDEALAGVRDGRINNAAAIIALQWLALNRAEVRGLWG